jgi:hypothetical protein
MPEVEIDWRRRHDACAGFLADALRAFPTADRISGSLLEDLRDARAHCVEKLAQGALATMTTATAAAPEKKAASTGDLYPGYRDPWDDSWISESLPPGDDSNGLEDFAPGAPILPEPTAPRPWAPSPGYPVGADADDSTGFE